MRKDERKGVVVVGFCLAYEMGAQKRRVLFQHISHMQGVDRQNWQTQRPTGLTGRVNRSDRSSPVRSESIKICNLESYTPIVTRFGRGTTSWAYRYKGCADRGFFNHN